MPTMVISGKGALAFPRSAESYSWFSSRGSTPATAHKPTTTIAAAALHNPPACQICRRLPGAARPTLLLFPLCIGGMRSNICARPEGPFHPDRIASQEGWRGNGRRFLSHGQNGRPASLPFLSQGATGHAPAAIRSVPAGNHCVASRRALVGQYLPAATTRMAPNAAAT